MPDDWFEINANLGPFESPEFKMGKPGEVTATVEPEMDVEMEKHKRNLINAIIQGTAKKGHYVFQKPEVRSRLNDIDPRLYPAYLGIMTINDFMYFTMEEMIEMMSESGQGIGGAVKLESSSDDDGDGDGDGASDTTINAWGLIFPILCHEVIKGLEEAKGRYGFPEDADVRQRVQQEVDTLPMEAWTLRIGPQIVEKIRFALPAEEFIKIIGDAISEDTSKQSKATDAFRRVLQVAKKNKETYEDYESEEDSDEEDGLDFLTGLGIGRPD